MPFESGLGYAFESLLSGLGYAFESLMIDAMTSIFLCFGKFRLESGLWGMLRRVYIVVSSIIEIIRLVI